MQIIRRSFSSGAADRRSATQFTAGVVLAIAAVLAAPSHAGAQPAGQAASADHPPPVQSPDPSPAAAPPLATPSTIATTSPRCPAPPAMTPLSVPHLQAAIGGQPEAVIVALGSSSTEGVAATDQAHDYPAILQAALSAALPHAHIAVLNRGIGGQDAPEELARLDTDVIAVRPQLVIWQVGANGAMQNADPTIFKHMVTEGVRRMHEAKIDVVLMDNQRAPHVDASPDHLALESAMVEIAHDTGASLFSRGVLMDAWAREGAPEAQFISSDGVHHNNRGYYCVATQLAAEIVSAVRRANPVTASR